MKLATLSTALLWASATASALAAPIQIKLGHVLSERSTYQLASEHFAQVLQQELGEQVTVRIYPNSALGGEIKLVQGARTGVVDAMIVSTASLENTVQEYRFFSLPYLFDDYAQTNRIMQGPVGDRLLEVLPRYNMVGLGWGAVYARSLAAMKPVADLAALQGLKIRVIQSPGYVEAYRALGAQPTPAAYAELFLSLQNGVVDAAELSPDQTVSDGFADTIQYYARTAVHHLPSVLIMSKARFDRLPPEVQQAVRVAGRAAMQAAVAFQNEELKRAWVVLEEKGVVVQQPDLAPFRQAARVAWPVILQAAPGGEQFVAEIDAAK